MKPELKPIAYYVFKTKLPTCVQNCQVQLLGGGRFVLPALGVLRRRWSLELRQLDIPQIHGDPSSDFSVFF